MEAGAECQVRLGVRALRVELVGTLVLGVLRYADVEVDAEYPVGTVLGTLTA